MRAVDELSAYVPGTGYPPDKSSSPARIRICHNDLRTFANTRLHLLQIGTLTGTAIHVPANQTINIRLELEVSRSWTPMVTDWLQEEKKRSERRLSESHDPQVAFVNALTVPRTRCDIVANNDGWMERVMALHECAIAAH